MWLAGLSEMSLSHDSHRRRRPPPPPATLRVAVRIPSVIPVLVTSMFLRRRALAPCILSWLPYRLHGLHMGAMKQPTPLIHT